MKTEKINILILGSGSGQRWLEEIKRANEESENIEITGEVLHPYDCMLFIPEDQRRGKIYKRNLSFVDSNPEQRENKNLIKQFDAVIPRISGERVFEYGCNVIRQLALNDVYTTSPAFALENCSNKWKTSQLLSLSGLPVPDQLLLNSPEDYREALKMVGNLPAVGKLSRGSQGNGVFLLESPQAAITALQSMEKLKAEITLNRFVKTGNGEFKDIRVWVIGCWNKEPKLYAMQRSTKTDFRTNLSLEGIGSSIELTKKEKEICIKAAQVFNMDVCAVDLIRDIDKDDKAFILELNGNPGLKIEQVLDENIVGAVVDHVIETINEKKKSKISKTYSQIAAFERFNESDKVRLLYHPEWKMKLNRVRKMLTLINQQRLIRTDLKFEISDMSETINDLMFVLDEIDSIEWMSKGVY